MIKADIDRVFQVVTDVERWPEFLPNHKKTELIVIEGNRKLIESSVMTRWGIPVKVKTFITIDKENRLMKADHIKGMAKGLIAVWKFREVQGGTELTITHDFSCRFPIVGGLYELLMKKSLQKIRNDNVDAFKKMCEI